MTPTLTYRWLGVAGLEFTVDDHYTLLIDPFLTRPSLASLLLDRRVTPNTALIQQHIPRADAVLVTHPHYDHLMDVPAISGYTKSEVYGSPNTCQILAAHNLPPHPITLGDRFPLGPFHITINPAWHTRTPLDFRLNRPLPARLTPPLRLSDYRMDHCFSFLLEVDDLRIQVGSHPVPNIDLLFIAPFCPIPLLTQILTTARPRRLIPIHWDDFTRPLSQPLRSLPLKGPSLSTFQKRVTQIFPSTQLLPPNLFQIDGV